MPRGGIRKGAGRKTQWASGCTFSETTVIRVPKKLKSKLLEVAHKLDAGEEIDLVTESIRVRNDYLEKEVLDLKSRLAQYSGFHQFELLSSTEIDALIDKELLESLKVTILESLKVGRQSQYYKRVSSAFNREIGRILALKNK